MDSKERCLFLCLIFTEGQFFFKSLPEDMFIDFKERGREREKEGNIDVKEKHQFVASHRCLNQGSNQQPRHVPLPRIEPTTFRCMG